MSMHWQMDYAAAWHMPHAVQKMSSYLMYTAKSLTFAAALSGCEVAPPEHDELFNGFKGEGISAALLHPTHVESCMDDNPNPSPNCL